MKIAKGAVIGFGVVAALGAAVPGFAGGNKYDSVSESQDCGSDGHINWVGAQTLWPPNHKFSPASVQVVDDSGDNVTITVTPTVTDAAGGDGGPQHDPDYEYTNTPPNAMASGAGSAEVPFQLRSERSGRGDGRTYTINWSATTDDGSTSCSSSDSTHHPFVAAVPHDMRDK